MITGIQVTGPRRPDDPLPPAVIHEFEVLLTRLDDHSIRRHEWERLRTILVIATLEASDAQSGQDGYERALEKWRVSRWYDGHE